MRVMLAMNGYLKDRLNGWVDKIYIKFDDNKTCLKRFPRIFLPENQGWVLVERAEAKIKL